MVGNDSPKHQSMSAFGRQSIIWLGRTGALGPSIITRIQSMPNKLSSEGCIRLGLFFTDSDFMVHGAPVSLFVYKNMVFIYVLNAILSLGSIFSGCRYSYHCFLNSLRTRSHLAIGGSEFVIAHFVKKSL